MKIKTMIVDDEALARERLRTLLAKEEDVEVVRECASGDEAIDALADARPDLIFLDIQMPGKDGFGVMRALPAERPPRVIFVTAFDEHAVRAFEVNALDYLLKPFKQARFQEALNRARCALKEGRGQQGDERLERWLREREAEDGRPKRIAVRIGERVVFVRIDSIDWIEAAGNYAVLHCGKENHVVRATLGGMEQSLPQARFLRVSRSAIVNAERVKELQPMVAGDQVLVLNDGAKIPVTRGLRVVQERLRYV